MSAVHISAGQAGALSVGSRWPCLLVREYAIPAGCISGMSFESTTPCLPLDSSQVPGCKVLQLVLVLPETGVFYTCLWVCEGVFVFERCCFCFLPELFLMHVYGVPCGWVICEL